MKQGKNFFDKHPLIYANISAILNRKCVPGILFFIFISRVCTFEHNGWRGSARQIGRASILQRSTFPAFHVQNCIILYYIVKYYVARYYIVIFCSILKCNLVECNLIDIYIINFIGYLIVILVIYLFTFTIKF